MLMQTVSNVNLEVVSDVVLRETPYLNLSQTYKAGYLDIVYPFLFFFFFFLIKPYSKPSLI